jgi:ribosomal protein S18 acetylase RimI-like enzyme
MGDVDRLAELWVDLARSQRAYRSHLLDEENYDAVREAMARSIVTGEALVARAASGDATSAALAGFVTFGIESGAYDQDARRGVVHNLFVRPDWRDDGLGGRLLSAAESALADRDAEVVSLEAMVANVDAIRFYERHGYRPHRVELEKSIPPDGSGLDSGAGADVEPDSGADADAGADADSSPASDDVSRSDRHTRER